jgi:glycosyltransferase involved in cell wall biosynthesis
MFLYWGRRGALTQFALQLGQTAAADPSLSAVLSVSRQNESFDSFGILGSALFPVDTFRTNIGAITQAWRIPVLRQALAERVRRDGVQAVIELMPHVWTRFVITPVRQKGARYVTIIHDADPHPGDATAVLNDWLLARVAAADLIVTLSTTVCRRLEATGRAPRNKIVPLFHPDLRYGPIPRREPPTLGEPFRILFFGRIMPYKGFPIFLDAVEVLHKLGVPVEIGVFGEGLLGVQDTTRLRRMRAEVVNRWIPTEEVASVFQRFHAIVLSHVEASQSGVASAALGAGLPVIATPTGGLTEQITNGKTGVLATSTEPHALADAIRRLICDPTLYRAICQNIVKTSEHRSMTKFLADVVAKSLGTSA